MRLLVQFGLKQVLVVDGDQVINKFGVQRREHRELVEENFSPQLRGEVHAPGLVIIVKREIWLLQVHLFLHLPLSHLQLLSAVKDNLLAFNQCLCYIKTILCLSFIFDLVIVYFFLRKADCVLEADVLEVWGPVTAFE